MLVGMSSYRQKLFTFKEEYNSLKVNNSDKYDLSPLTNVRKRTTETKEITIRTVTIILKVKELPSSSFKLAELMKKCQKKNSEYMLGNTNRGIIQTTIRNGNNSLLNTIFKCI